MRLPPTYLSVLKEQITQARFKPSEFTFENKDHSTVFSYSEGAHRFFFDILPDSSGDRFLLRYQPGRSRIHEEHRAHWHFQAGMTGETVLQAFSEWLSSVRRELAEARADATGNAPPEWLPSVGPDRLRVLRQEIAERRKEVTNLSRRVELLWQTGIPLNKAVAVAFVDLDFQAELTDPGATYDVLVTVAPLARLLVEVTGIEGYVQKKSSKMAQVVEAFQGAQDGDRVVLAVNVYRDKPPESRSGPLVSENVERLLVGMGANALSTMTLYTLWELGLTNREGARARIEALYRQEGGVFS